MDSVTLAYYLKDTHKEIDSWTYLSFDYGQRHSKEIMFANICARELGADHNIIGLQPIAALLAKSGSVLVDHSVPVPEGHYAELTMQATVVPNRNSIMLAIATGVAVAQEARFVAAGMHAGDHFIYPDCRPEFIESFNVAEKLANVGFWAGHIVAPFVDITKTDIVAIGSELKVPYENTWSCYKGGKLHCGKCGTCVERREAFSLAGIKDPTTYE